MGKKGGSNTTVQSYQPTAQEIRLQQQAADYSEAVAPNALNLNNLAAKLLKDSYGSVPVDFTGLTNNALETVNSAQQGIGNLANGILPSSYQENMEKSIKTGVENSMGSLLTGLGNRGVINSSVTNTGVKGINDSAANAMANAYNDNVAQLSQLYGQQINSAGAGITTAAGGQEAAQSPALNLWNASLGLNNGATLGALNAMSGQGTTTATQKTSGGSGLLGGVLSGLASNSGLFCFTENTQVDIPNGKESISRLKVGDKVIAHNIGGVDSEEKVIEIMPPHYADVYVVVCQDDSGKKNIVNTTLSQPFLTTECQLVKVSELGVGREIEKAGKILSIIYSGERKVYDIKITGSNLYYADGFIAKGGDNEW